MRMMMMMNSRPDAQTPGMLQRDRDSVTAVLYK